jgi:hypothetical protein
VSRTHGRMRAPHPGRLCLGRGYRSTLARTSFLSPNAHAGLIVSAMRDGGPLAGLALVHNGNLTNTQSLQEKMRRQNRHLDTQARASESRGTGDV